MADEHDKSAFFLLGVIFVSFVIALLLLKYTGINIEFFLTPTKSIANIVKGNVSIFWSTTMFFLFFLSVSLSILVLYTLKHEPNLFMSIVLVFMASFVFIFYGFTTKNFYAFFGLFFCLFATAYFAHSDVDHYKKISAYRITSSALRKGFLILNLFLAISVFSLLKADLSYGEQELQGFLKSTTNIDISNLDNMQQQILQEQEKASFAMLESMETALLYSIYAAPSLSLQEKATCFGALNSSMQEIDKMAKEQLKSSMSQSSPDMGRFSAVKNMLNMLVKYYPFLTALTFFFIMNIISKIAIFISSLLSWLLWRFFKEA